PAPPMPRLSDLKFRKDRHLERALYPEWASVGAYHGQCHYQNLRPQGNAVTRLCLTCTTGQQALPHSRRWKLCLVLTTHCLCLTAALLYVGIDLIARPQVVRDNRVDVSEVE